MLWRFNAALCKKLHLCIYILWVTVGFLLKIQVALICLTNFTGLLLPMQTWQTMPFSIERPLIYTCSLLWSPLYKRGFSSTPGINLAVCGTFFLALRPSFTREWRDLAGLQAAGWPASAFSKPRPPRQRFSLPIGRCLKCWSPFRCSLSH